MNRWKTDRLIFSALLSVILLFVTGMAYTHQETVVLEEVRARLSVREIDFLQPEEALPTMCDFGGCPGVSVAPTTTETETTTTELIFSEPAHEDTADVEPLILSEEPIYDEPEQNDVSGSYLGVFKCTAYCGCYECSEGYGNMTATGVTAQANRTIAVDPSVIPYGTWVIINGQSYKAEDCGGGVNGNHIDIYFDSHSAAEAFGLQYCDVYLA